MRNLHGRRDEPQSCIEPARTEPGRAANGLVDEAGDASRAPCGRQCQWHRTVADRATHLLDEVGDTQGGVEPQPTEAADVGPVERQAG